MGATAQTGDVFITAEDSSLIDARLRSVAVAVSVAGKPTPAVALGMSVARNFIGKSALAAPVTDFVASKLRAVVWDHLSDEGKTRIAVGDRVRIESSTLPSAGTGVVLGQVFQALSTAYDDRSDAGPTDLGVGERVRLVSGADKDQVYEFLGGAQGGAELAVDLSTQDYGNGQRWKRVGKFQEFGEIDLASENFADASRWRSLGVDKSLRELSTGQTVLNDTDPSGSQAYRYVGDPIKSDKGIDLATQNFGDESIWSLLGWQSTIAQTQARLTDATVQAGGRFSLDAQGHASIQATVLSGAAAVGASGSGAAVAVSAAGVYAENRIASSTLALAESTRATPVTIVAGQASLLARDRSSIDAIAGAAAVSASLAGAGNSVSVSIGLAIALNSIDTDVLASARGVDLHTTVGDATVSASSAAQDLFAIDWGRLSFDATALDAAANADRKASRVSDQGQTWDYRSDEGPTVVRSGDQVMIVSSTVGSSSLKAGQIYKYTGASEKTFTLGDATVYAGAGWQRVDIAKQELLAGYTVKVAEGHSYGGLAGRVYRFIGIESELSTEDGKQTLSRGTTVTVGSNHEQADKRKGQVYQYQAEAGEVDLATTDFGDSSLWKQVDTKENVALWCENYADTQRWVLADGFADPATVVELARAMKAQGLTLAKADTLHNVALYSTADGVAWNFTSDSGKQDLVKGKLVGITDAATGLTAGAPGDQSGVLGGQIYRFLAADQKQVDLALENYKDTARWQQVTDNTRELFKGNTVKLAQDYAFGGQGGQVYRFVGKNHSKLALATEDYSDTSRWALLESPLRVSVVEAGKRWQVIDVSGQTWQLHSIGGQLSASRSSISAVVAAASMGMGLSSLNGIAVSGAGALALNAVRGSTSALIENSTVRTAGDLVLDASSSANITATVAAFSASLGAGGSNGVAVSIGVAVARNLIGQPGYGGGQDPRSAISALIEGSTIETVGDLVLRADAQQSIHALVLSGSAAIALAGNVGVSVDGSGVWAENLIGVQVDAGVDPGSATSRIRAASLQVSAEDRAAISAVAAAASISAALSGNVAVAVSIGVSLARNVIDNQVSAHLRHADADVAGAVTVGAVSTSSISVVAAAAAAAVAIGGGSAGVGVAGAGASAINVILGRVQAQVSDSDLRIAGPMSLTARNAARIDAVIVSAALGVGVGAGAAGVGASIGLSLARNYIGYDPKAWSGKVSYDARTDNPSLIRKGDVVRLASNSGVRANDVYEYIGDEDLKPEDNNKDGKPDKLLLTQDYGDDKRWVQLTEDAANLIQATVDRSSIVGKKLGAGPAASLSLRALDDQAIEALVLAGSAAASVSVGSAVSISGAGAGAVNRIGTQVLSRISATRAAGISLDGSLVMEALDRSAIDANVMAMSVAASISSFGGSVALAISVADNKIANTVQTLVDRADIRADNVTLSASEQASIKARSTAVSMTADVSLGVSLAGGGAKSINTIATTTEARVDALAGGRSSVITPGSLSLTATSAASTDSQVVAAAASFGAIGVATAGTVADNVLRPETRASIGRSDIEAGEVVVSALSQQSGLSKTAALTVSTAVSVGMAKSSVLSAAQVEADLGDEVQMYAGTLRIKAYSNDALDLKAMAASGGANVGIAGAYSDLTIEGTTQAGMGNRNQLLVGTVDIRAAREQIFDSASLNLAIGGFAGSGALIDTEVGTTAQVLIGQNNEVQTGTLLVNAQNLADKRRYVDQDNLRSGSAGGVDISALRAATDIGTVAQPLAAKVVIGSGTLLSVDGPAGSPGILRIETLVDVAAVDKVRVEGVSGLGLSIAKADLSTNVLSSVEVLGAQLRNQDGAVTLSARTDADLTPAANTFSAGLINGAGALANGTIVANSLIIADAVQVSKDQWIEAGITGLDVNLYAGRDAFGMSNQLFGSAHADMAMVSGRPGPAGGHHDHRRE